ncbi:MAG: amidohydrolase family protein [Rhizobiaceae bacterium]|nr:amidohydrolase family protein [Rhizobiaceae bacterium]
MRLRLGRTYQHLAHDAGCLCTTPLAAAANERLSQGLTRREMLGGAAASLAIALGAGRPSKAFAQAPGQRLLLTNARIFDGRSATLIEGRGVLVSGSTIEALVPSAEQVADAEIVDCAGGVVMPGLIDAHWHTILAAVPFLAALTADVPYVHLLAAKEAERTLLRGFTTVRDVGGPAFALKRVIDESQAVGPRIYPSGAMVSQTSGHGDFRWRNEIPRSTQSNLSAAEVAGVSAIADGEAEVLRRTREQLLLGASQIKIVVGGGVSSLYDPLDSVQFRADEIRAAVDAAADWGTYVCAHVYTPEGIKRALANGVKSIEHGQLADEDSVRMMADKGAWWSIQPFLADEDSNPKSDPVQRRQQEEIAVGTVRAFELGPKHGVKLAFGTDILFNPGGTSSQGRQLAKLARWMDPATVLRMATSDNADLLGLSGPRNPYPGRLGVVEPGALADLLVVAGNPLQDISLISDPDANFRLIMKGGRVHKNTLAA